MNFGATLRALRTERKLSQQALAQTSGLAVNTVSCLERGRAPDWETVQKIARALGVGVEVFANGKPVP